MEYLSSQSELGFVRVIFVGVLICALSHLLYANLNGCCNFVVADRRYDIVPIFFKNLIHWIGLIVCCFQPRRSVLLLLDRWFHQQRFSTTLRIF
jgi:hypothetical protein